MKHLKPTSFSPTKTELASFRHHSSNTRQRTRCTHQFNYFNLFLTFNFTGIAGLVFNFPPSTLLVNDNELAIFPLSTNWSYLVAIMASARRCLLKGVLRQEQSLVSLSTCVTQMNYILIFNSSQPRGGCHWRSKPLESSLSDQSSCNQHAILIVIIQRQALKVLPPGTLHLQLRTTIVFLLGRTVPRWRRFPKFNL